MLTTNNTLFVLVDVQGKLSTIVHDSEELLRNTSNLIQGLQALQIPIIWLEQYPEGLGPTNEQVAKHLTGLEPIPKMTFSGWKTEQFQEAVKQAGREKILIAGIETHICVYQTAADLQQAGYQVQVVEDAVSSRTAANKQVGLDKMKALGILPTSVEMALYEIVGKAGTDEFKKVLKLIK